MGGCNTLCSKTDALSQILPDAQTRRNTQTDTSTLPAPSYSLRKSFHGAAAKGNTMMLTYYVSDNSTTDLANSKYNEVTPLHIAVQNKQYHVMEFLLENQANPNIGDDERGDTPLHIACRQGDLRAVKILCQHQADTSIVNEYEETALIIALQRDTRQHRDIATYLQPNQKARYKLQQTLHETPHIKAMDTMLALRMADSVVPLEGRESNEWFSGRETQRLSAITNDVLAELQDDFKKKMNALGPLAGWLERQQHSPPYSWLKRWVVVQNGYLLWSDRQMDVVRNVDKQERRRWNKCIQLIHVTEIKKIGGKKQKFMVEAKNIKYVFRTESKEARDYWVNNLEQHLEVAKVKRNPMYKDRAVEPPSKLNSIL